MIRDAVVVGGGFYGAAIAAYLTRRTAYRDVLLLEQDNELMQRASYNNQARVHNGYHYPRSMTTAMRSRVNFPRFVSDWAPAIRRDFLKMYAIAKGGSKTTARQFWLFCRQIGAPVDRADSAARSLFEERVIEDVFLTEEFVFDARILAKLATEDLGDCGVEVCLNTRVVSVRKGKNRSLSVGTLASDGGHLDHEARIVLDCTYSGLNHIGGRGVCAKVPLKHEITEMALLDVPPSLGSVGITVMDGPYFSLMPFPDRAARTLSHVRYTPHQEWRDDTTNPYRRLEDYGCPSRVDRMIRDASRYLPDLKGASYMGSLMEVKTVLVQSEADDSRPILFEQSLELPGLYFVLGSKIDNIYDIFAHLDRVLGRQAPRSRSVRMEEA